VWAASVGAYSRCVKRPFQLLLLLPFAQTHAPDFAMVVVVVRKGFRPGIGGNVC
jgi:hypothetical protein